MDQKKDGVGETRDDGTLPWDDSDFARISQDITRSVPAESVAEGAPMAEAGAAAPAMPPATPDEREVPEETGGMESHVQTTAEPVAEPFAEENPIPAEMDEEPTAAGKLLDEEFPRLIKLKGMATPLRREAVARAEVTVTKKEPSPYSEPAGTETVLPPRKEPSFAKRRTEASDALPTPPIERRETPQAGDAFFHGGHGRASSSEPRIAEERVAPRFVPVLERRNDDEEDSWDRGPPRFEEAFDSFPIRTVPEPIVPKAFAPAEDWWDDDRPSALRWVAVTAFLVVGCYAAVNALQPERFFLPRQMEVARNETLSPAPAPATAPPTTEPAKSTPSTIVPPTTPSTTRPAAAPAKPAPTSTAGISKKEPKKTFVATPTPAPAPAIVPAKPAAQQDTTRHKNNEPDEAELEALAERQTRPVTLAPGPRMLDASPAIPASLPTRVSGDLVYDVQSKLMRLGYSPGPVDGTLSPQTRNAIMHFQNDAGLRPTGEIDAALLQHLRATRQVDLRFQSGPAPVAQ